MKPSLVAAVALAALPAWSQDRSPEADREAIKAACLARWNGQWKIVNVLWELKPAPAPAPAK